MHSPLLSEYGTLRGPSELEEKSTSKRKYCLAFTIGALALLWWSGSLTAPSLNSLMRAFGDEECGPVLLETLETAGEELFAEMSAGGGVNVAGIAAELDEVISDDFVVFVQFNDPTGSTDGLEMQDASGNSYTFGKVYEFDGAAGVQTIVELAASGTQRDEVHAMRRNRPRPNDIAAQRRYRPRPEDGIEEERRYRPRPEDIDAQRRNRPRPEDGIEEERRYRPRPEDIAAQRRYRPRLEDGIDEMRRNRPRPEEIAAERRYRPRPEDIEEERRRRRKRPRPEDVDALRRYRPRPNRRQLQDPNGGDHGGDDGFDDDCVLFGDCDEDCFPGDDDCLHRNALSRAQRMNMRTSLFRRHDDEDEDGDDFFEDCLENGNCDCLEDDDDCLRKRAVALAHRNNNMNKAFQQRKFRQHDDSDEDDDYDFFDCIMAGRDDCVDDCLPGDDDCLQRQTMALQLARRTKQHQFRQHDDSDEDGDYDFFDCIMAGREDCLDDCLPGDDNCARKHAMLHKLGRASKPRGVRQMAAKLDADALCGKKVDTSTLDKETRSQSIELYLSALQESFAWDMALVSFDGEDASGDCVTHCVVLQVDSTLIA